MNRRATTFIRQLGGVNIPDVYFYNWRAISNANFAPSGWSAWSASDRSLIEGYCNYYGESYMFQLSHNHYRNSDGDDYSFTGTYYAGLIEEYDATNGRFGFLSAGTFYARSFDYQNKLIGNTVILIKNNSTDPGTLTDYDGNVYDTIKIGTGVFTVQTWKCKHLNDGTLIPYAIENADWSALTGAGMVGYNYTKSVFC